MEETKPENVWVEELISGVRSCKIGVDISEGDEASQLLKKLSLEDSSDTEAISEWISKPGKREKEETPEDYSRTDKSGETVEENRGIKLKIPDTFVKLEALSPCNSDQAMTGGLSKPGEKEEPSKDYCRTDKPVETVEENRVDELRIPDTFVKLEAPSPSDSEEYDSSTSSDEEIVDYISERGSIAGVSVKKRQSGNFCKPNVLCANFSVASMPAKISNHRCEEIQEINIKGNTKLLHKSGPKPLLDKTQLHQILGKTQSGQILDKTQLGQILDKTQPGQILDKTQPGQILDKTQPGQIFYITKPEQIVDKTQPEQILDKTHPEQIVDKTQTRQTLDKTEQEQTLDKTQQKQILDKTQQEQILNKTQQEQILDKTQQEQILNKTQQEQILDKTEQEQTLDKTQQEQTLDKTQQEQILDKIQQEQKLDKTQPGEDLKYARNRDENVPGDISSLIIKGNVSSAASESVCGEKLIRKFRSCKIGASHSEGDEASQLLKKLSLEDSNNEEICYKSLAWDKQIGSILTERGQKVRVIGTKTYIEDKHFKLLATKTVTNRNIRNVLSDPKDPELYLEYHMVPQFIPHSLRSVDTHVSEEYVSEYINQSMEQLESANEFVNEDLKKMELESKSMITQQEITSDSGSATQFNLGSENDNCVRNDDLSSVNDIHMTSAHGDRPTGGNPLINEVLRPLFQPACAFNAAATLNNPQPGLSNTTKISQPNYFSGKESHLLKTTSEIMLNCARNTLETSPPDLSTVTEISHPFVSIADPCVDPVMNTDEPSTWLDLITCWPTVTLPNVSKHDTMTTRAANTNHRTYSQSYTTRGGRVAKHQVPRETKLHHNPSSAVPLLLVLPIPTPVTPPRFRPIAPKIPPKAEETTEANGNKTKISPQINNYPAGQDELFSNILPGSGIEHENEDSRALNLARQRISEVSLRKLTDRDVDKDTYLHIVVCQYPCHVVQAVIERLVREDLSGMINAQNLQGQTPLYLAASMNNAEIVQLLIEHGADVNTLADTNTYTGTREKLAAIHNVTNKGDKFLKTLQVLLRASSIDLNLANSDGYTALISAIIAHRKDNMDGTRTNSIPIIQALMEAGADPTIPVRQNGKTALMYALESHDLDLIEKTFELVEPSKLATALKTKAFNRSSCIKIAKSLESSLNLAGKQRLSNCLRQGARRRVRK